MKRHLSILILFLLMISSVSAATFINGKAVTIDKDLKDNLFIASNTFTLTERLSGDLIAAASTITSQGEIRDDAWLAAQTITISDDIGGDLRAAAQTITIDGDIDGDVMLAASTITITENADISGDVLVTGATINIDGDIDGELKAYGDHVTVRSTVEEDSVIEAQTLAVYGTASFGEDLNYTTDQPIEGIEGLVDGKTTYEEQATGKQQREHYRNATLYAITLIITGMVLGNLLFRGTKKTIETQRRFWLSSLVGLVSLICIPILSVLLMFTIVGLPLGILLLVTYVALIFLAYVTSAAWLGSHLFHKDLFRGTFSLAMLIGGVVLVILLNTPYLGGLVSFFALISGMGALILAPWKKKKTPKTPEKKSRARVKRKNKT